MLDLTHYSHVNRRAERFSRIDLADAVNGAIASLARPIEETGAVLEIGALPQVWGDSGDMAQVFRNLIGNSIKFRRPDTAPHIVVDAAATPEGWQVSVRDNGIGFDPNYAEQVFVIFKRLHPAHVYPGTGIGLTICKSIIERHSGQIWCESKPGIGTGVHFVLPAAADGERG